MTHIDWPMLLWCGGLGTFGALLYVLAQAFYGMYDDWQDDRARTRPTSTI